MIKAYRWSFERKWNSSVSYSFVTLEEKIDATNNNGYHRRYDLPPIWYELGIHGRCRQ